MRRIYNFAVEGSGEQRRRASSREKRSGRREQREGADGEGADRRTVAASLAMARRATKGSRARKKSSSGGWLR
jgi:hypothetical protein